MRKLRVGIVGLGGIAQKVYLPILSQAKHWELVGAYTQSTEKLPALSAISYRCFFSLDELAATVMSSLFTAQPQLTTKSPNICCVKGCTFISINR